MFVCYVLCCSLGCAWFCTEPVEKNQQDTPVSQIIYSCKTLHMFRTVFPSIIRSSRLHIHWQVCVNQLLLPAASRDEVELQSFRPSSGAQECTYSDRRVSFNCCYLLPAGMRWDCSSTSFPLAAGSSGWLTHACHCMCRLELLMMDGKTVQSMWSVLQFHLIPASSRQQQMIDIRLSLYVQSWAPDDGRKDCPKHVECFAVPPYPH
jgi:hypothetical protein